MVPQNVPQVHFANASESGEPARRFTGSATSHSARARRQGAYLISRAPATYDLELYTRTALLGTCPSSHVKAGSLNHIFERSANAI